MVLFYSILRFLIYFILFYSFLFYSILYYNNKVRWIKINLLPPGFELATSGARRPHSFFHVYLPDLICTVYLYLFSSSYFCGLNILRLFVGKIQFIFCGLNIFRLFVGNIQFIFFGMNVSQSIWQYILNPANRRKKLSIDLKI